VLTKVEVKNKILVTDDVIEGFISEYEIAPECVYKVSSALGNGVAEALTGPARAIRAVRAIVAIIEGYPGYFEGVLGLSGLP